MSHHIKTFSVVINLGFRTYKVETADYSTASYDAAREAACNAFNAELGQSSGGIYSVDVYPLMASLSVVTEEAAP